MSTTTLSVVLAGVLFVLGHCTLPNGISSTVFMLIALHWWTR